jgi:hypothetical protein
MPSTLSVTWWLEDGLLDAEHKRHRTPLIQADLLNLFKCSIKEVTKILLQQSIVQASDVASLAFVIHASYLEHVWVNCAGMELVYFTCYYVDNNNALSILPLDFQVPFVPNWCRGKLSIPHLVFFDACEG